MENIENLKNEIVEGAATKAAEATNKALESKATEINENVESKMTEMAKSIAAEAKSDREIMQKSIDELAASRKSFGIGSAKVSESVEQLKDIQSEFRAKGKVTTDLSQKTFVAGASTSTLVPSQYDQAGTIYHNPNFKVQLRDVINTRTSDGGSIIWNRETAETDSAGPKAFGAAATQTSKTLTRQESTFRTLTNFYTMPEEFMDDIVGFESYISNRLMMDLLDAESRQILGGSGAAQNYNGINTFGTQINTDAELGAWANSIDNAQRYDAIIALGSLLEQSDFSADCVILNPFDFNQLALIKATDGDYVLRNGIDPGTGKFMTYLATGMQVIKSNAQTANTFTVFDKSAFDYVMREGVAVEFDRNANDFQTNSVSVRAQLRGNLADWLPAGALNGTFTGATGIVTLLEL